MSKIELTEPPTGISSYKGYKPWLLDNFFYHTCSYCLMQHLSLEVEHYEPESYKPDRVDDPANLLLACRNCNGPGGKWDYHPLFTERIRLKKDGTKFYVLDIRSDNFGDLYEIDKSTGKIYAKAGASQEWAIWNALTLFKFDLDFFNDKRKSILEKLDISEQLLEKLDRNLTGDDRAEIETVLSVLIPDLARQYIFLYALDIEVSGKLLERIENIRLELKGKS